MKRQRVYLDTSVLGGCFDPEFAEWSNGLIRDFRRERFVPVLSEVTAAEVQEAPETVQAIYAELLTIGAEVAQATEDALELADVYQDRRILTPKFYDDGLHIALATVAEVDVLTSWNFRHIVHFDKIRLFAAINIEYGYKALQIFSPREVMTYDSSED